MPDADSNRKRSRSPSDSEPGKLYKRANTGTAPAPDDSNSGVTSSHDVTMSDAHASARANSTSTPSPKPTSSDPSIKKDEAQDAQSNPGDSDDIGKSSATTTGGPSTAAPAPSAMIHMRCLIVTQDASIIIGKGGTHVNEIREKSGARVMVSESIPGNPERILNVSGPLDAVSKVSCPKLFFHHV